MARTSIVLAILAFALVSVSWARPDRSLAGVVSSGSTSSGTTTSSGSCTVTTTAKAYAFNQFQCKAAFDYAFDVAFKSFCKPVNGEYGPIPEEVVAEASATATATIWALATARSAISYEGQIGRGCQVPQSYSAAYTYAKSVALAQAVASAYSDAIAVVYGYLGAGNTPTEVIVTGQTSAYTYACSAASTTIWGLFTCNLYDAPAGALSPRTRLPNGQYSQTVLIPCGYKCTYQDSVATDAFASATATAITNVVATVKNQVDSCGYECAKAFCDSFCVDNNC